LAESTPVKTDSSCTVL